ncbi:hypothetical protein BDV28DRAFT_66206 [Aspergillus coremiiformis]|uniref:Uncharacterized protein n=1 Tax=Aspergillus coremiiformis TaxID=138285 RepID=A0A5N6ZFP7_9EURO|nr:hypothetical protein BDV28DRAFT_66206 [Aspergillus coremiiformis]
MQRSLRVRISSCAVFLPITTEGRISICIIGPVSSKYCTLKDFVISTSTPIVESTKETPVDTSEGFARHKTCIRTSKTCPSFLTAVQTRWIGVKVYQRKPENPLPSCFLFTTSVKLVRGRLIS